MSSRCDECKYQDDGEFHACYVCTMEKDMFRKKSKPTNADRIRAKTDDELADYIIQIRESCEIPNERCVETECRDCIATWLQQEAKEDEA